MLPWRPPGSCVIDVVEVRRFLVAVEVRFPPPNGQHHVLLLSDDARASLVLVLHIKDRWIRMRFEDADLGKSTATLLDDLETIVRTSMGPA